MTDEGTHSSNIDRFFALSNDLLCIVGFDGILQRVNPALERVLGHTEAALCNESILDYLHPDDQPTVADRLRQIKHANPIEELELRVRSTDGTYRWLS